MCEVLAGILIIAAGQHRQLVRGAKVWHLRPRMGTAGTRQRGEVSWKAALLAGSPVWTFAALLARKWDIAGYLMTHYLVAWEADSDWQRIL